MINMIDRAQTAMFATFPNRPSPARGMPQRGTIPTGAVVLDGRVNLAFDSYELSVSIPPQLYMKDMPAARIDYKKRKNQLFYKETQMNRNQLAGRRQTLHW